MIEPLRDVRNLLKLSLGLKWAAPEILFLAVSSSIIEPEAIWLLSGLALWYRVLHLGMTEEMIEAVSKVKPKARLGAWAHEALKKGIVICPEEFRVGDSVLSINRPWKEIRSVLERHLRIRAFGALATRRPDSFGCLGLLNSRVMRKFIRGLDHYSAMVLLKIWTGSTMVGAKRQLVTREPSPCSCGEPLQTLKHLAWECPMHPVPEELRGWESLEPYMSVSHLLGVGVCAKMIAVWKKSCIRLIGIVSRDRKARLDHAPKVGQANGHEVVLSSDSTYAYCSKCHIARLSRDAKWIFGKECLSKDCVPFCEGQEFHLMGHKGTLVLERWKVSALRPRMKCRLCSKAVWATAGFSMRCPKEET